MTPDTSIRVIVTPNFQDYLHLNWLVLFRKMRLVILLGPIILAACVYSSLYLMEGETYAGKILKLLPLLLFLIAIYVTIPVFTYINARKLWRTAAVIRDQKTFTFSEAGIHVAGETFEGFLGWQNIIRAERRWGMVLVVTTQQQYYLIPLQAFEVTHDYEQFCQLLEAKIPDCRV